MLPTLLPALLPALPAAPVALVTAPDTEPAALDAPVPTAPVNWLAADRASEYWLCNWDWRGPVAEAAAAESEERPWAMPAVAEAKTDEASEPPCEISEDRSPVGKMFQVWSASSPREKRVVVGEASWAETRRGRAAARRREARIFGVGWMGWCSG